MVLIETTIITLLTGIGLFFFGIYIGKKGLWISLSGSLIIMILGILIISQPIQFRSGAIINNINITDDQIIYTYQTQDTTLNIILGNVFLLMGIFGIIISSIKLYNLRFDSYQEVEI